MKPVLLDTGVVVALLDRSERHHTQCAGVVTKLGRPLATVVFAEVAFRGIPSQIPKLGKELQHTLARC